MYTYVYSFIDLGGKSVIKGVLGDGYSALLLLQKYCSRITNNDISTCEEKFNSTKIFNTESVLRYISRFHDPYLVAESVGSHFEDGKLIDKFLLSMKNCHNKYKPTILSSQTQWQNETFTNGYNLAPLTLSEIEAALSSIDEKIDTDTF